MKDWKAIELHLDELASDARAVCANMEADIVGLLHDVTTFQLGETDHDHADASVTLAILDATEYECAIEDIRASAADIGRLTIADGITESAVRKFRVLTFRMHLMDAKFADYVREVDAAACAINGPQDAA